MSREDTLRKMHSKLDQWNHEISQMMARKDQIAESAKAEFNRHLDDLKKHRDQARQQIAQVEQASESAWKDVKSGFELAWEALAQAIESARSRYK